MSWIGPRSIDGGLDQIVVDGAPTRIWLCGKRVVGPDPEAALARIGAPKGLIVCLCEEHEIDERYPRYVQWLAIAEGQGALWRPIPDLGAPPRDRAETMAAEVNAVLDDGRQVIIHCGAGLGRAPTMAICALLARGCDLGLALGAVAESRPMAGPETGVQRDLVEGLAAGHDG